MTHCTLKTNAHSYFYIITYFTIFLKPQIEKNAFLLIFCNK